MSRLRQAKPTATGLSASRHSHPQASCGGCSLGPRCEGGLVRPSVLPPLSSLLPPPSLSPPLTDPCHPLFLQPSGPGILRAQLQAIYYSVATGRHLERSARCRGVWHGSLSWGLAGLSAGVGSMSPRRLWTSSCDAATRQSLLGWKKGGADNKGRPDGMEEKVATDRKRHGWLRAVHRRRDQIPHLAS